MSSGYSIKDVIEEFRRDTKESLERIEKQTTKTNGRVDSLEHHRSYLWGAYTVLSLFGGVIIYLAIGSMDTRIKEGIVQALEAYKIENVE